MDRRDFLDCGVGAATVLASGLVLSADAKPKLYAKTLLTTAQGEPLRASSLKPRTNYLFNYPFEGTPAFLLDLAQVVAPKALQSADKMGYQWPGGVGKGKSLVAFSAICAHKLVYPTAQISFISFRAGKSANVAVHGDAENVIHCCADHTQYDPAQGAQVLRGPATQALCAVLLHHDAKADTLTAYATLGGELFDEFFRKYDAKLSLDMGGKAKNAVAKQTAVREMAQVCKQTVRC